MKIKFLVYHMTLVLYSVAEAFIHIWCEDTKKNAYNAATWWWSQHTCTMY